MTDSRATGAPQPELRLLRAELAGIRRELAEVKADRDGLRTESDELRHQLQVLRNSTSWKLTAPVRLVRRRVIQRGEF